MSIFSKVETFLRHFCPSSSPLLLALSGGPDSLCLFYSLLAYRNRYGIPFHIAHVDHGWRQESQAESQALQQLASYHQVPFHLKILVPTLLKGNLEAACREERYAFFASICQQIDFQAVLTGHHQDDQAETVFKRVLEGAHWSRWTGLKSEGWIQGVRILRPLLTVSKSEIRETLVKEGLQAFEDPTNRDLHFLRARLRETIFPWLNQKFGKQVQKSFIEISEEAQELVSYFELRLAPLLDHLIQGPWGVYLDLQNHLPVSLVEIKYLLRLLCARQFFFLSRMIIEKAAKALQEGQANQLFVMGSHHVWIDRRRVFIIQFPLDTPESQSQDIRSGSYMLGNWKVDIKESVYSSSQHITSWRQGWQGCLTNYLPFGSYRLGFIKNMPANLSKVKKRWSQAKIPAFLYAYFPLIWTEKGTCYEFLTGKPFVALKEDLPCWKVNLTYSS
jgi:tRNA(Ile)-lysidine synthase